MVVSMAGYNSVTEILRYGSRALLVPRVSPRKEQLVRATILSELKLANLIPLSQLTQENLTATLLTLLRQKEKPLEAMRRDKRINLEGCVKLGAFLQEVLNSVQVKKIS